MTSAASEDHAFNAFAAAFPLPEDEQQQSDGSADGSVNGSAMDMDDNPPPGPDVGVHLQQRRAGFNATNIRRSSKDASTFSKHQKENERFILYLFDHEELHPYLYQEFLHELHDEEASIDYSQIISGYSAYARKSKSKNVKSLQEKKDECREKALRAHISYALNEPSLRPRTQTVDLHALEQNVNLFLDYIASAKKDDGGMMRPKTYAGYRSSLTYLFSRYRYTPSQEYERDIKECMAGVKRYINKTIQAGEGNIWDGDRPLTWGLYEQFNKWFYEDGSDEGIFAVCFAKLTMNLACRGKNTGQICLKHIKWEDDCMSIPFAHSKDHQSGNDPIKKLPRHCYSNPLNFASDLPSAMFHYLCLNPDVLSNEQESLFPGSYKSQAKRFGDYLKKICNRHKVEIQSKFGFDIRDIGVHSWRKGAHTKLNTGSTSGPSGAAACIRGGHRIGGAKDVYIATEKASDTYCGRILQGLPEHEPEFAVSYPDFFACELIQSLTSRVSEEEFSVRQAEVNNSVTLALNSIFGEGTLNNYLSFVPILRVGLASHLIHYDCYDRPIDATRPEAGKLIPDQSHLRLTTLFTNPMITGLKEHVSIAMPWQNHYKYFKPATGIPPHVMIYAYIRQVREDVQSIPNRLEEILDDRQMIGGLSMNQITDSVVNSPMMQAMARDVSRITRWVNEGGNAVASTGAADRRVPRQNMRLQRQYQHGDGKRRRVPPSWKFPSLGLQNLYVYWHFGDESNNIPPMKYLDNNDVSFLSKRARSTLTEHKKVMAMIDSAAEQKGCTVSDNMTQVEVQTCYRAGESAFTSLIPTNTPKDRNRKAATLKLGTLIKLLQAAKKRARESNE